MIPVRIEGSTLEVGLPPALLVTNRMELIEAVAGALGPGLTRVRLDAAVLREIDSAGLGALARVLRESIEATGNAPQLVNARAEIIESMRAVGLHRHFDHRAPEENGWSIVGAVVTCLRSLSSRLSPSWPPISLAPPPPARTGRSSREGCSG